MVNNGGGMMTDDPTNIYKPFISQCIKTQNLKLGQLLHSRLIKTALTLNAFLTNRIIELYSKCHSFSCAQKAFDEMPLRNTHSWNTMISAYAQMGQFDNARRLLDEMPEPNLVSYNSLISGLTQHGFFKESLSVFRRMQRESYNVVMDEYTVVGVAGSCHCHGKLKLLRQVHGVAVVMGVELNVAACNAMIFSYGKCGDPDSSFSIFKHMVERDVASWTSMVVAYAQGSRLEDAYWLFNQMPVKNTHSWTALISCFAQHGRGEIAIDLFKQMQHHESLVKPNCITFVSVLSACADLALLDKGKQLHGHIVRTVHGSDKSVVFLSNALVDMYCKCGKLSSARTLFEAMTEKDIVSWNSLITGLSQNGYGDESLSVFRNMIEAGVKPNQVTFLGVLSACNHRGLVNEGLRILNSMEMDYDVTPRSDHYAVLIDLLGRKNRLAEAVELAERAPGGLNHVGTWGALLGACRVHGDLDLACRAGAALLELEPQNAARHVMLSNIYTAAGKWAQAEQVRALMVAKGLRKDVACSWIDVRSTRHEFVAKDRFEAENETEDLYLLLDMVADQMKDTEYRRLDTNSF